MKSSQFDTSLLGAAIDDMLPFNSRVLLSGPLCSFLSHPSAKISKNMSTEAHFATCAKEGGSFRCCIHVQTRHQRDLRRRYAT